MDKDKQIYPLTARILRPLRWEMNCIQVEIKGERSSFMKVAGIIAEYNPFHKGHQYHIEETRKKTGADYVVVVMSGDYVQRENQQLQINICEPGWRFLAEQT